VLGENKHGIPGICHRTLAEIVSCLRDLMVLAATETHAEGRCHLQSLDVDRDVQPFDGRLLPRSKHVALVH
jgi:hypothetical protein